MGEKFTVEVGSGKTMWKFYKHHLVVVVEIGLLSAHNDNPETTTYRRKEKASLERCVDLVQWRLRVKIMAVGNVEGLICVHKIKQQQHRFTTLTRLKEK
jgi:hypothetical protein